MSDEFVLIETNLIPQLTTVRFYEETWVTLRGKHSEFTAESQKKDIVNAVRIPTEVYDSKTRPGKSFVFVDRKSTYMGNALVVPVSVVEGTSGRVQTAYYRGTAYNSPLLWKTKDE